MNLDHQGSLSVKLALIVFLIALYILLIYLYTLATSINAPNVLLQYRLARGFSAALSGFILAVAGCFLQVAYRNPLVDHHVLGIGGGALFLTYVSIILFGYIGYAQIFIFAITGGLIALILTVQIAEAISGSDVSYVLSGIGITTLFSGLSLIASYYAITRYRLAGVLLMGSFAISNLQKLLQLLIPLFIVTAGYILTARKLNVILLGDENARQLGVDPRKVRLLATVIAGVSASIVVSHYGLIGFIGLVSPHMSRLLLKTSDNRVVIPLAGLIGSSLTYTTDQLAKQLISPIYGEVPAGAVISVIGAPFFIYLLVKRFSGRAL